MVAGKDVGRKGRCDRPGGIGAGKLGNSSSEKNGKDEKRAGPVHRNLSWIGGDGATWRRYT